jgi:PKHD-type hydroxylase
LPLLHVTICDAFSTEDCRAILSLAGEAMTHAPLWNGTEYHQHDAGRRADLTCLDRGGSAEWLFERLDGLFAAAAERLGTAVRPLQEQLQLLRYGEGGHFQQWHSDAGLDAIDRRLLSVSVELSEPEAYDGGDLQIAPSLMAGAPRPLGSARIFFSRALHRVTPVTRGTRWALVGWTGGPGGAALSRALDQG